MRSGKDAPPVLRTVFMMELLKPLSSTWDEVGPHLHDLRDASFRMFNVATRAACLAPVKVHPATHAYRQIGEHLEEQRTWNAKHYKKTKLAFALRRSTLEVPSGMRAYASNLATKAYQSKIKDILRGTVSIPSYRKNGPLQVPAVDYLVVEDEKGFVLEVKLHEGRAPRVRFAVVPCGGGDHGHVRRMLAGGAGVKRADLKLVWSDRKRSWFAKVCYAYPKPAAPKVDVEHKMAVHRGIRTFLTWACGDAVSTLDDGGRVLKMKALMAQKGASLRRQARRRSGAFAGHGTSRRFASYAALEDKEKNFVRTFCQEKAAHVCDLALKFGAGTIVIEDYSARELADDVDASGDAHGARFIRRWPFFRLKLAIETAAERRGLVVETVPSQYESCTCPACGHVDASQDDRRGSFTCVECKLKRSVDAVAAWNMLRAAGDTKAFAQARVKQERFAAALRPKVA